MARAKKRRTRTEAAKDEGKDIAELGKSAVVGKQVMCPLKRVVPNEWNPNRMTQQMRASLKHGLKTDGWLASQALLVWGTDENGEQKDIIIDGEHRWTVAMELGFEEGPMVFLKNLSEAQAKALTIKMNQKRGEFQEDLLSGLLRDIQFDLGVEDLALETGFGNEEMMKMLAPNDIEEMAGGKAPKGQQAKPDYEQQYRPPQGDTRAMEHVRLVQLFLSAEDHERFMEMCRALKEKLGGKDVTEVVFKAVEMAHAKAAAKKQGKKH